MLGKLLRKSTQAAAGARRISKGACRSNCVSSKWRAGEVFVRVLGHLSEQEGSFTAWLYRIAANVVIDHTRSKRARRESALNEDTVRTAGAAEASDRHLDLEAAIAELTDDQRELVTLKFIQGLTNGEIAEITGRSPEAIRTLQFRALMALRQILDRRAEGAGHEPQDR